MTSVTSTYKPQAQFVRENLTELLACLQRTASDDGIALAASIVEPRTNLVCLELQTADEDGKQGDKWHLTFAPGYAYRKDHASGRPVILPMVRLVRVDDGELVVVNAHPWAILAIVDTAEPD